ncbi:L-ascorbate metabolism protein UlaG (beta-lactamase superfamily) [Spinactinospora alkalitolerans]|uniref:L-ascorbate metabolism protein UlaG (Beta-lactamase superfamily) n=1 Tax=Spinactinospora alkalitolerans TaxID=687207 RepID=A0A852U014_9ACTN|nr:MBL fold metallo-hydrolase [Spinactinospora alkalitolerans]NYE50166.1 L-ascorbate metabolism protein UlaG (beta-lactamase superfamily) [Spinactinospora alkalitolerans]
MRPGAGELERSLLFVGNATVLIRWDDVTVLTDPNFLHRGQWAYLGKGLVSRRLRDPALDVRDLPDLDAIVLSHLHGDHFDRVARHNLDHDLPVATTRQAARRLRSQGFERSVGLDTWQEWSLSRERTWMRVVAVPGRHGPRLVHRLLPPVMGSVIEFGPTGGDAEIRIYVTGDTLMFDGVREIPRRHPDIDLALLHLGGTTLPGGVMVTMDGRQGADLIETVDPRRAAPIHYDDYGVFKSPLHDFREQVFARGLEDRIRYLQRGESVRL